MSKLPRLISTCVILMLISSGLSIMTSAQTLIDATQINLTSGDVIPLENGGGGTSLPAVPSDNKPWIRLGQIDIDQARVTINWKASVPARYRVRWGSYDIYPDGSSVNNQYGKEGQIVINGLDPDTKYWFELGFIDQEDDVIEIKNVTLRTLGDEDTSAINRPGYSFWLQILTNLKRLNWQEQSTSPSQTTYQIRYYSIDPLYDTDDSEGQIIYEGSGTSYDSTSLRQGYYSLYTKLDLNQDFRRASTIFYYPQPDSPDDRKFPDPTETTQDGVPSVNTDDNYLDLTDIDTNNEEIYICVKSTSDIKLQICYTGSESTIFTREQLEVFAVLPSETITSAVFVSINVDGNHLIYPVPIGEDKATLVDFSPAEFTGARYEVYGLSDQEEVTLINQGTLAEVTDWDLFDNQSTEGMDFSMTKSEKLRFIFIALVWLITGLLVGLILRR